MQTMSGNENGSGGRAAPIPFYRKPVFWIILAAAAVCVILAVILFAKPSRGVEPEESSAQSSSDPSSGGADTVPEITSFRSLDATLFYEEYFRSFEPAEADLPGDDSSEELPIARFASKEAFDSFFAAMTEDEKMNLMPHEYDFENPNGILTQYDEGFFTRNELYVIGILSPSSDRRYSLDSAVNHPDRFTPAFLEERYEEESDDFRYYLYFIGVRKGEIAENQPFGARLLIHENKGSPKAARAKKSSPITIEETALGEKLTASVTPIPADSFTGRITDLYEVIRSGWNYRKNHTGSSPGYMCMTFRTVKDAYAYLGLPDLVVPEYPYEPGATDLEIMANEDGSIGTASLITTEYPVSAPERDLRVTVRCSLITDRSGADQYTVTYGSGTRFENLQKRKTASGVSFWFFETDRNESRTGGSAGAFLAVNDAVYSVDVVFAKEEDRSRAASAILDWTDTLTAGFGEKTGEGISPAVTEVRPVISPYTESIYLNEYCDNADAVSRGGDQEILPVRRIVSKEALDEYFGFLKEKDIDEYGYRNLEEEIRRYDSEFFEDSELYLIAYHTSSTFMKGCTLEEVTAAPHSFSTLFFVESGFVSTDDIGLMLYFISVRKGEVSENADLSSQLLFHHYQLKDQPEINPLLIRSLPDGSYQVRAQTGLIPHEFFTGSVSEQIPDDAEPAGEGDAAVSVRMFPDFGEACDYVGLPALRRPVSYYPPGDPAAACVTVYGTSDGKIGLVEIETREGEEVPDRDIYSYVRCLIRTNAGAGLSLPQEEAESLSSRYLPKQGTIFTGKTFCYAEYADENSGWNNLEGIFAADDIVYTILVTYRQESNRGEALMSLYDWAESLALS